MLTLILGGARSGKSRLAQRLAAASAGRVTYIATARAGDDLELAARIQRHRADRPASWQTIEEPVALSDAVERAAKDASNAADVILVDCLTVWLSNLFWEHRDRPTGDERNTLAAPSGRGSLVEDVARAQLQRIAAAADRCRVILVSNELGSGTVPEPALTRAFRDTHGLLNQWTADAADEVILTIAGLPLYLKTANKLNT